MEEIALSEVQEKGILQLAIKYKQEAKKCYKAKAYLSGCVLIGAAMETILLATANCFTGNVLSSRSAPKKKGKIKRLDEFRFIDLIAVAKELNWLPSELSPKDDWNNTKVKIGDYVEVVRQIRNLIHPVRYINDFGRKRVTKKYYDACYEIVNTAVDHLDSIINNSLSIMLEERERRVSEGDLVP